MWKYYDKLNGLIWYTIVISQWEYGYYVWSLASGSLMKLQSSYQYFQGFIWRSYKASAEKKSEPGSQARKGEFIRGKREGDWLLRRTSILPFWQSRSYAPPVKNSLKGWSRSRRSGIWWSRSFEKIGASEITGCHLGNLVSLTDHCDFILCEVTIMSHLISETPCRLYPT